MDVQRNHQNDTRKINEWVHWMGAFLLLNIADILLTSYMVIFLGALELNPIMRFFTSKGIMWFFVGKIAFISLIMWSSYVAAKKGQLLSLRIATFLYTVVIGWNIWALP